MLIVTVNIISIFQTYSQIIKSSNVLLGGISKLLLILLTVFPNEYLTY